MQWQKTVNKVVNKNTKGRVILIHGMWMNTLSMRFIGRQLKKRSWQVSYYRYSSMFASFDQNVGGLYQLWQKEQSANTHLVGHSLGGLLVLAMMEKYRLTDLPRTILMGCPVNGSAVVKKMLPSKLGKAALGESAQALLKGHCGELQDAASQNAASQNKIGIIIGSKGFGIGHLIQRLPIPHDGVVAYDEVNLKNAEDKIILPVAHASMLVSRKIPDAIDKYLLNGYF